MFRFTAPQTPIPAHAYRLKAWPCLPDRVRTAAVYRAFSRMCQGPVSLRWFVEATRLAPQQAQALLAGLVASGELESIDIAKFAQAGLPS
jgi:hypothetical protein